MFFKLILYGGLLLLVMVAWSWVRTLRSPWARRNRGALGWILSALTLTFLFALLKAFLPKL